MNAVAEELTGWKLSDAGGKPVSKVFTIISEISRQVVENPVTRVLKEGVIVGLANHTLLVRKDGIEIPIDDSGAPIKGTDGQTSGVVLIFRDIIERKKAEAKIESMARFPSENPNAVLRANRDGRIIYANAVANNILDFWGVGPGDRIPESTWSRMCGAVYENLKQEFETEIKGRWLALLCVPIPGQEYVNIYGTDITERKKLEQLKDEFIGLVSHELKTPITVIIGAIDTAITPGVTEEEQRQLLDDAFTSAGQLAGIVDNLLELSRVQANRLSIRKEPIDISRVAEAVVKKLDNRSVKHRLSVEMPGLPRVTADQLRIERILHNLVENAIKYSPAGGDVIVFARPDGDHMLVGVKDQGIGLSDEDQARLFKPFERLDMSPNVKGVGLGLMVSQRLVEAHGGRIWVESAPFKGTTFFFTLPLG
jgi:PAS domain S-box-containing protein